jgi:hypothetical protein
MYMLNFLIQHVFRGCDPPFHSDVYVSGHFNNLAAVAFLTPPRSPAKKPTGAAVSPTVKLLK